MLEASLQCAAQANHSDLLLLKKLTYAEQHLLLALAWEEESSNNSVDGESGQTRASLWPVREQPGLGLEARFLAVFLQRNRRCKISHSCRE